MDRMRSVVGRGDVWDAEFDPVRGNEQAGRRPAVIVSADRMHQRAGHRVYVMPLTQTDRGIPWHVPIEPPEGGVVAPSFIMCDQMRIVALERLCRRRGSVSSSTLTDVEDRLRVLLNL